MELDEIRERLERLGTIEVNPGVSRGKVVYSGHIEIRAEIRRGSSTHYCTVASLAMAQKWSTEEGERVVDLDASIVKLWAELSTAPYIANVPGLVAFWWDESVQDWRTSPHAPEGWPKKGRLL